MTRNESAARLARLASVARLCIMRADRACDAFWVAFLAWSDRAHGYNAHTRYPGSVRPSRPGRGTCEHPAIVRSWALNGGPWD